MPILWQTAILDLNDNKCLIQGVVLTRTPYLVDDELNRLSNLWGILRSYAVRPFGHQDLVLKTPEASYPARTDAKGSFEVVLDTRLEGFVLETPQGQELPSTQSYPKAFAEGSGALDVISDIDDTVLVSYTAQLFRRIKTLLWNVPRKRKTIGFSKELLNALTPLGARTFYVSKSESNLFGVLSAFVSHHQLPEGMLLLTSYLHWKQLLSPKKGRDFKVEKIKMIMRYSPGKSYVLLGDDSQRDLEVYGQLAEEFPGRVIKIYIRKTRKKHTKAQLQVMDRMKELNVALRIFEAEEEWDEEELKQTR